MELTTETVQRVLRVFEEHGGLLRYSEAIHLGVHPRALSALTKQGLLEQLERGLYAVANLPSLSDPDIAIVAKKVPSGVICLVSALSFHGLTTEIPRYVYVAIPAHYKSPSIAYPPVRFFRFSDKPLELGVEQHQVDRISFRVFSIEKTLVDCFRFRNKIGLEVGIEALKAAWNQGKISLPLLTKYAKALRAWSVMKPYIEAIITDGT